MPKKKNADLIDDMPPVEKAVKKVEEKVVFLPIVGVPFLLGEDVVIITKVEPLEAIRHFNLNGVIADEPYEIASLTDAAELTKAEYYERVNA